MASPDLAALDARALNSRREILRRLWHADGRVSGDVRAVNPAAPPRFGLHISMGDSGSWLVSAPDAGVTRGVGFVALIAFLADVPNAIAAQFLARLIPTESASR